MFKASPCQNSDGVKGEDPYFCKLQDGVQAISHLAGKWPVSNFAKQRANGGCVGLSLQREPPVARALVRS